MIAAGIFRDMAESLQDIRRKNQQKMDTGSAEAYYIIGLTTNIVSYTNAVAALIASNQLLPLPSIMRDILEMYAKAVRFFNTFFDAQQCEQLMKEEVRAQIKQDCRTYKRMAEGSKAPTDPSASGRLARAKQAICDICIGYYPDEAAVLTQAEDETFVDKLEKIAQEMGSTTKLTDIVTEALLELRIADAYWVYPTLCSHTHSNIGSMLDRVIDENNTLWPNMPQQNTERILEILEMCLNDLIKRWSTLQKRDTDRM